MSEAKMKMLTVRTILDNMEVKGKVEIVQIFLIPYPQPKLVRTGVSPMSYNFYENVQYTVTGYFDKRISDMVVNEYSGQVKFDPKTITRDTLDIVLTFTRSRIEPEVGKYIPTRVEPEIPMEPEIPPEKPLSTIEEKTIYEKTIDGKPVDIPKEIVVMPVAPEVPKPVSVPLKPSNPIIEPDKPHVSPSKPEVSKEEGKLEEKPSVVKYTIYDLVELWNKFIEWLRKFMVVK